MATTPNDIQAQNPQPKRRGRPPKPDALTPAERMRRYRARKKAGLVQPKPDAKQQRIEAMEAELEQLRQRNRELERKNEVLKVRLEIMEFWHDEAKRRAEEYEFLRIKYEALRASKNVTRDEKPQPTEVKELWHQADGRCQIATKRGTRCRCRDGLVVVKVERLGQKYEVTACRRHAREIQYHGNNLSIAKSVLELA